MAIDTPERPKQPALCSPRRVTARFIRRHIFRATLGFIITILAALSAHAISDIHSKEHRKILHADSQPASGHRVFVGYLQQAFGASFVSLNIVPRTIPDEIIVDPLDRPDLGNAIRVEDLPGWVRKREIEPYGVIQPLAVQTSGVGVPFKSLRYVAMIYRIPPEPPPLDPDKPERTKPWHCPFKEDLASLRTLRPPCPSTRVRYSPHVYATVWGAIDIYTQAHSVQANHAITIPSQIPITPIWAGLLANTAIYTSLIWLTCWSLATLRRRIHSWRNPNAIPCKRCWYDLKGLSADHCPECGHSIPESTLPVSRGSDPAA